jgi:membrane-associated protease RseP (regulator of RpoE activity)
MSAPATLPAIVSPTIPTMPPSPAAATFQPATPGPTAVPPRLPVAAQPVPAAAPQLLPRQSAAPAAHTGGRLALGVRTVPVDPAVQSRFQMADSRGAYVIGVVENLPAARAGVPPGSVIVAINQQPVRSPQDLTQLVTHGPAGTPVTLDYVLPGGEARHASVVLQSLDEPLERALVGDAPGPRPIAPAPLQSAPQVARRVESTAATRAADDGQTIVRLEATLRRMAEQLERLDQRLERLESRR